MVSRLLIRGNGGPGPAPPTWQADRLLPTSRRSGQSTVWVTPKHRYQHWTTSRGLMRTFGLFPLLLASALMGASCSDDTGSNSTVETSVDETTQRRRADRHARCCQSRRDSHRDQRSRRRTRRFVVHSHRDGLGRPCDVRRSAARRARAIRSALVIATARSSSAWLNHTVFPVPV